jgi:dimethylglycine dehydrogenase
MTEIGWRSSCRPTGPSRSAISPKATAGPRSREILAKVTAAPLDTAAFPWMAVRSIDVGTAHVTALRVSYVGELGYELHVPMDNMPAVYDALCRAGEPLGLKPFGLYAMDSLRLEKGYLSWKGDITTEFTPLEAGLDRFVTLEKPDFVGRLALMAQHNVGPRHRLVTMTVEGASIDAPYGSLILRDDVIVGFVTSAGHGHRTGQDIALGYVLAEHAGAGGRLDVVILGRSCAATVAAGALYDPANARLKG